MRPTPSARFRPARPRQVELIVSADGARAILRVIDTGPGIPPDVKAQMFSPFFTTKAPGEGTGLGLFVSYGIAEAHGGTLTAESVPGEGATLILSLPVAETGARAAWKRAAAAGAPHPGRGRRPRHAAGGRGALLPRRTPRGAAASGAEALRLARAERFDLIIADRLAAADGVPLATALAGLPGDASRRLILSTSDPRPGSEERPAQRTAGAAETVRSAGSQEGRGGSVRNIRRVGRRHGLKWSCTPLHSAYRRLHYSEHVLDPAGIARPEQLQRIGEGPALARPGEPVRGLVGAEPLAAVVLAGQRDLREPAGTMAQKTGISATTSRACR